MYNFCFQNFKVLADDISLRGQKLVFWNFKKSVIDICIGIDPTMVKYFREGLTVEDVLLEGNKLFFVSNCGTQL